MIMNDKISKFLKKCLYIGIGIFVFRCFFGSIESLYDFIGATGEVVSFTMISMAIYCRWIWRYNPLEKMPRIMGEYEGMIEYILDGTPHKKEAHVVIKQSLLSIKLQITTNEITSNSIVSELIEENGQFVLYYTYITNPKSKYSKENPIQYGTCKLLAGEDKKLVGTYWTSRQTIGDIELTKINHKQ